MTSGSHLPPDPPQWQGAYPPLAPPSSAKRRRWFHWFGRHKIISSVLAAFVAVIVLAGIFGQDPDKAKSASPSAATSSAAPSSAATSSPGASSAAASSAAPSVSAVAADLPLGASGSATTALALIPVKGRAASTGYSRGQFGQEWTDANTASLGNNGCDTRDDILRRDLTGIVTDSTKCTVVTGALLDPYTAAVIALSPSSAGADEVQIDHVVSLSDAWQTGAQQLTVDQRTALANDPLSLLAVSGKQNDIKGDGDAATWLPPNKTYRCSYVARQVAIKARYGLWMTPAEHDAVARILATCPAQALPAGAEAATYVPPSVTAAPAPTAATPATTAPVAVPTTAAPAPPITTAAPAAPATTRPAPAATTAAAPPVAPPAVYYANCAAAKAAGAAPLHVGEPGYRAGLDRDNDGVACE
jgi:hypothetical protein